MSSAGGAATNAGVNFQQRLSAFFLICLYAKLDLSDYIEHYSPIIPSIVSYETSSSIDDINIHSEEGGRLLIQAKHSISLSESITSEFYNVIKQFLSEHIKCEESEDLYLLITSTCASSNIYRVLQKFCNSVRCNDTSYLDNPLNKKDIQVYNKYRKVFNTVFVELKDTSPTEEQFIQFTKKVKVHAWDIDSGMPFEKSAILLLHMQKFPYSPLVWSFLIAKSLDYASSRMSINSEAISELLSKYKFIDCDISETEDRLNELLRPSIISLNKIATGKEVLLVVSCYNHSDLMLLTYNRFDKNGNKRNIIEDGYALFTEDERKAKILQRFASITIFNDYFDKNPHIFKSRKLIVMDNDSMVDVENSKSALKYREKCIDLIKGNTRLTKCLHSGINCLSGDSYFVELDTLGAPHCVGMVSAQHLRPTDRILSVPVSNQKSKENYVDIDVARWLSLEPKGQWFIKSLKHSTVSIKDDVITIAWNKKNNTNNQGQYCLRFNLVNEGFCYWYIRGKISRFYMCEAKDILKDFTEQMKVNKTNGNPFCVSSETHAFSKKDNLKNIVKEDESIIEVASAEICEYSDIMGRMYNQCDNFYAPLCYFVNKYNGDLLTIANILPLLSDPFSIHNTCKNWDDFYVNIDNYSLNIIRNDHEFDAFVEEPLNNEITPTVNPILSRENGLVGGYIIEKMETLLDIMPDNQD